MNGPIFGLQWPMVSKSHKDTKVFSCSTQVSSLLFPWCRLNIPPGTLAEIPWSPTSQNPLRWRFHYLHSWHCNWRNLASPTMTSQLHHRPDTPENDQIILAALLSWTTYKPLSGPPLWVLPLLPSDAVASGERDPPEVVAMVTGTNVINRCGELVRLNKSFDINMVHRYFPLLKWASHYVYKGLTLD